MNYIEMQKAIAQDLVDSLMQRYMILETVNSYEPIGRRKLMEKVSITERALRNHLNYMQQKGIILIDARGVMMREKGRELLPVMHSFCLEYNKFYELENELKKKLGIKDVYVVSGNSDIDENAKIMVGLKACEVIASLIEKSNVIAISGGQSTNNAVNNMGEYVRADKTVIPLRGSFIGDKTSLQSNSIAKKFSEKLGCEFAELLIPDIEDKKITEYLLEHPAIKKVTDFYDKIDLVIFGIGNALNTARRRGLDEKELEKLQKNGAICEVLGYYINSMGKTVGKGNGIVLDKKSLEKIPNKLAVASGENKVDVILACSKFLKDMILVTDEAAATALIKK